MASDFSKNLVERDIGVVNLQADFYYLFTKFEIEDLGEA